MDTLKQKYPLGFMILLSLVAISVSVESSAEADTTNTWVGAKHGNRPHILFEAAKEEVLSEALRVRTRTDNRTRLVRMNETAVDDFWLLAENIELDEGPGRSLQIRQSRENAVILNQLKDAQFFVDLFRDTHCLAAPTKIRPGASGFWIVLGNCVGIIDGRFDLHIYSSDNIRGRFRINGNEYFVGTVDDLDASASTEGNLVVVRELATRNPTGHSWPKDDVPQNPEDYSAEQIERAFSIMRSGKLRETDDLLLEKFEECIKSMD